MTIEAELADGRILEFPDGTHPDVIKATVKKTLGAQPAAPSESAGGSPAVAGMVNFGAGMAGFPMDIAQGVYNAPKMLYGLAKGAMGGTDLPEAVTGTPGTSESLKRVLQMASEMSGIKSISPENPTPESKIGTLAYNLASKGAFVPGMALPAVAAETAGRTLGPQYEALGALVPTAAISAYNAARAPTLARQQAQNVTRDATLKAAQEKGYVTPPSAVNPTSVGNTIESIAGKPAMRQEAELKNQQVTNSLVREELKVPENTPLTEGLLDKLREAAAEPYRQVSKLSPIADKALQRLRDARSEANDYWRSWDRNARPEDKRQAMAADAKATSYENLIEREAKKAGRPELVGELRDGRTFIAKTFDVERALNVGNGNVDAQIIGRMRDRRGPEFMTGNLKLIGEFAEGPGRQFTREASKVPAPGVSGKFTLPLAAALGMEGYHYLGSPGAMLAGIPFAGSAARAAMLSPLGQKAFGQPSYEPAMQPLQPLPAMIQQGVLSNQ